MDVSESSVPSSSTSGDSTAQNLSSMLNSINYDDPPMQVISRIICSSVAGINAAFELLVVYTRMVFNRSLQSPQVDASDYHATAQFQRLLGEASSHNNHYLGFVRHMRSVLRNNVSDDEGAFDFHNILLRLTTDKLLYSTLQNEVQMMVQVLDRHRHSEFFNPNRYMDSYMRTVGAAMNSILMGPNDARNGNETEEGPSGPSSTNWGKLFKTETIF